MALMDNSPASQQAGGLWGTKASRQTGAFAGPMMNEMLYADLIALQRQEYGKTQSEKNQGVDASLADAARLAGDLQEEQNRYAASQGGFSGRHAEQSRDIASEAVGSAAAAYAREDRLNREEVEAKAAETRAAGYGGQDRNIDRRRYLDEAHNTRATNLSKILSMM